MSKIDAACQTLGCVANDLATAHPRAAIAIAQTMVGLMRSERDAAVAALRGTSPRALTAPAPANRRRAPAAEASSRPTKPSNRRKAAPAEPAAKPAPKANQKRPPAGDAWQRLAALLSAIPAAQA